MSNQYVLKGDLAESEMQLWERLIVETGEDSRGRAHEMLLEAFAEIRRHRTGCAELARMAVAWAAAECALKDANLERRAADEARDVELRRLDLRTPDEAAAERAAGPASGLAILERRELAIAAQNDARRAEHAALQLLLAAARGVKP